MRVGDPSPRGRSRHSRGRVADDPGCGHSLAGRGGAPLPGSEAPRTRRKTGAGGDSGVLTGLPVVSRGYRPFHGATAPELDQPATALASALDDALPPSRSRDSGGGSPTSDGASHPLPVGAERRLRGPRLPGLGEDRRRRRFGPLHGVRSFRCASDSFHGAAAQELDPPATARPPGWTMRIRDPSPRGRSRHSRGRVADDPGRGHSLAGRGGAPPPGSEAPRVRRRRAQSGFRRSHGAGGRSPAVAPAGGGESSGWPIERRPVGRTLGYPRSINALGRPLPPRESGRSVPDSIPARSASAKPASGSENTIIRVGRPRGGPPPPTPEKPGTIPMREEWTT